MWHWLSSNLFYYLLLQFRSNRSRASGGISEDRSKLLLLISRKCVREIHLEGNEQVSEAPATPTRHTLAGDSEDFVALYDIFNSDGKVNSVQLSQRQGESSLLGIER